MLGPFVELGQMFSTAPNRQMRKKQLIVVGTSTASGWGFRRLRNCETPCFKSGTGQHTSVLVRTGMIDAEKGNNLWSPRFLDYGMHAFIMFQYQSGFPC